MLGELYLTCASVSAAPPAPAPAPAAWTAPAPAQPATAHPGTPVGQVILEILFHGLKLHWPVQNGAGVASEALGHEKVDEGVDGGGGLGEEAGHQPVVGGDGLGCRAARAAPAAAPPSPRRRAR